MSGHRAPDLEPGELDVDRLLSAAAPVAPPVGFRDLVMRRLRQEERAPYEWPLALALGLPSLGYLAWALAMGGADLTGSLANLLATAAGSGGDAYFAVDGLLILAAALFGLSSLIGTHALVTPAAENGR